MVFSSPAHARHSVCSADTVHPVSCLYVQSIYKQVLEMEEQIETHNPCPCREKLHYWFPSFKKYMFIDLREKEKHWCERNIDWLPPIYALTRDWTHKPGICPDWESNSYTFSVWDNSQPSHTNQGWFPSFVLSSLPWNWWPLLAARTRVEPGSCVSLPLFLECGQTFKNPALERPLH